MRTIRELISNNETVWFYLSNEEAKNLFYEEAKELNLHLKDEDTIKRELISDRMAVHSDCTLWYISIMVWHNSYNIKEDDTGNNAKVRSCPKIDYLKYKNGDDDYLLTKSVYTPC
ncbi:MAG: hypothetical protein K6D02_05120 [Lachnospiraceae bacterium]|nr:hypothetical protein [Lachnospiraceae bacterium]